MLLSDYFSENTQKNIHMYMYGYTDVLNFCMNTFILNQTELVVVVFIAQRILYSLFTVHLILTTVH